jgi:hypothetical protein
LFYASDINEISQFNLKKSKCVSKYKGTHNDIVKFMGVSPAGQKFFTAGQDGRFCFYKIPDFPDDKAIETPETIKLYGELPKIGDSYWASICMHGEEGEEKCIATNLLNEIMLIDMVNCTVLKTVKIRQD